METRDSRGGLTRKDLTDEELGAYVDNELDESSRARVDRALESNTEARSRVAAIRDIDALVRAAMQAQTVEEALPERHEADIVTLHAAPAPRPHSDNPRRQPSWMSWQLAASFVGGALTVMLAFQLLGGRTDPQAPQAGWQQSALVFHTTYLRAQGGANERLLVDVAEPRSNDSASSYASIIDYEPFVPDLSAHSYEPTGARVVSSPDGPTVFVIYHAPEGSPIGFSMIRAKPAQAPQPTMHSLGGVQLVSWSDGRFEYGLSGDLPPDALNVIAQSARESIGTLDDAPLL
jgi:anti-sigma factor RsiW